MLVDHCLELMNSRLKQNPCSLPRYAMNSDLELTERQQRIGGALIYACTSWVTHLTLARISVHTLQLLGIFVKEHFIHWMEVMSLVDKFALVIKQLHDVHDSLTSMTSIVTSEAEKANVTELLQWFFDGRKLASEFQGAVQESASHFYHSALPLSPEESLLRMRHSAALEQEVKILHGNISKWSHADLTISLPPNVQFDDQVFSHNGNLLAVKVKDPLAQGLILIYNVTTGECVHKFHASMISFTPDDTLIALDGGTGVVLHELGTGRQCAIDTCAQLSLPVCNLAFSPTGRFLAIGDRHSLVIWNVSSGQKECEVKGDFCQLEWLKEDPPSLIICQSDYKLIEMLLSDTNSSTLIFDKEFAAKRMAIARKEVDGEVRSDSRLIDHPSEDALIAACLQELDGCSLQFSLSLKHGLIAIVFDDIYIMHLESREVLSRVLREVEQEGEINAAFSSLQPLLAVDGSLYDITDPEKPNSLPPTIHQPHDVEGMHCSTKFSPTQPIFAIHRSLRIRLVPTRGPLIAYDNYHRFESHVPPAFRLRRQLSVSPDASKVIQVTANGMTQTMYCVDAKKGVSELEMDIFAGNSKFRYPPAGKLSRICQAIQCRAIEPGFSMVEVLNSYWQAYITNDPIRTLVQDEPVGFCLLSQEDTLVIVTTAKTQHGDTVQRMKLTMYSWSNEKILAQAEWVPSTLDVYDIGCINIDRSTGALTIFTPVGISGDWRVIKTPPKAEEVDSLTSAEDANFDYTLVPMPSDVRERFNSDLNKIYGDRSSHIQYPVLWSDDGQWFMNNIGQRILWIPYEFQTRSPSIRYKWRWCRERLFFSSDNLPRDPYIVDFEGVDVIVPTALQVYEKLGWSRVVISDLDKLEDGMFKLTFQRVYSNAYRYYLQVA
ncbi:hypothetical protein H0H92_006132 [Tricholoma furcatifolium]|nr:hypothetical protein H0H92_006132 [Tricholoma furcatifolium]